ncbi:MAG: hypothetical protein HXX16_03805 [Bacteroidales bacterium]|nr:hypothetical protein [Bacteroidales bacterium]
MKLAGLYPIYKELLAKNETYCVFKFTKNKVGFDVFFDIGQTPYKLGFLVIGNNFQLWLNIERGFVIDTNLKKADYKRLTEILGLKFNKDNKFSTFAFFEEFNAKIPTSIPNIPERHIKNVLVKYFKVEDEDKLYYDGYIDWDKTNIKKGRKPKNLEKTRLLFPMLYNSIKNKNISIKYTATPNDFRDNGLLI